MLSKMMMLTLQDIKQGHELLIWYEPFKKKRTKKKKKSTSGTPQG